MSLFVRNLFYAMHMVEHPHVNEDLGSLLLHGIRSPEHLIAREANLYSNRLPNITPAGQQIFATMASFLRGVTTAGYDGNLVDHMESLSFVFTHFFLVAEMRAHPNEIPQWVVGPPLGNQQNQFQPTSTFVIGLNRALELISFPDRERAADIAALLRHGITTIELLMERERDFHTNSFNDISPGGQQVFGNMATFLLEMRRKNYQDLEGQMSTSSFVFAHHQLCIEKRNNPHQLPQYEIQGELSLAGGELSLAVLDAEEADEVVDWARGEGYQVEIFDENGDEVAEENEN